MPQAIVLTSWTCPAGVHRVQARCIGGGGAGGLRSSGNNSGAAGGRGGNYARNSNLIVIPGSSYVAETGFGAMDHTQVLGGLSSFTAAVGSALAQGGNSCSQNSQTAPSFIAEGTGEVTYNGGAAAAGGASSGGGGGAAGDAGHGGNASGTTGGTGTSPGGNGANGSAATAAGTDGIQPGGGGSGGRRGTSGTLAGGQGAPGRVMLKWLPPNMGLLLGVGS